MAGLPLWLLAAIFVVAAAVVWVAGVQLSKATDVLDARFGLGSAVGGAIVLAVATNLPETAITVTAAINGNIGVAVGNILGGIALQTVVLVILDLFGRRSRGAKPLTYRAASLSLVIEGLIVIAVLAIVVAGTQLPSSLHAWRFTPATVLIVVAWVVGLLLVRRAGKGLPWHEAGMAPDSSDEHRAAKAKSKAQQSKGQRSTGQQSSKRPSTAKAAIVFAVSALATLAGGVVLERVGDAASGQLGLSGVLFGATVLALATSIPEISTGLQAVRDGDDRLAVSDIFGGNAFLPVLFLVAVLISGKPALTGASNADIYLTVLATLLTLVYIVGLIFRPRRRVLGMGVDSLVVLILYAVGVGGLFAIGG